MYFDNRWVIVKILDSLKRIADLQKDLQNKVPGGGEDFSG